MSTQQLIIVGVLSMGIGYLAFILVLGPAMDHLFGDWDKDE